MLAAIRPVRWRASMRQQSGSGDRVGEVFRYAIATGRCHNDPTIALRGALVRPKPVHRAAILLPAPFGALLRAIDGYSTLSTRIALQLLALAFVRPGELRHAEWTKLYRDLCKSDGGQVGAGKLKMRRPHRFSARTARLALLDDLRPQPVTAVTFSVGRSKRTPGFRKHAERRFAEARFFQRRNDGPRLSCRHVDDAERKRKMEFGRYRVLQLATSRRIRAARICAERTLGRAGSDDGLVGG